MVNLNRESVTVTGWIASIATSRRACGIQGLGLAARREGLTLTLEDERGSAVAEAIAGGDGRARFDVKTAKLNVPGQGELVVRFAGTATLAKASASQPVVTAEVRLALAPDRARRRGRGIPHRRRGHNRARPRRRRRGGDPPPGPAHRSVLAGGQSARAPSTPATRASPSPSPPAARAPSPSSSATSPPRRGYRAGPTLQNRRPPRGPRHLQAAPPRAHGARRRRVGPRRLEARAQGPRAAGRRPSSRPAVGAPGVALPSAPRCPRRAGAAWSATRTRARRRRRHTGNNRPLVRGRRRGARAWSPTERAFTLEAQHRSDARRRRRPVSQQPRAGASSAEHPRRRAGHPASRLARNRLVRWARRQGAPFDGSPEPTPGHVRRVASAETPWKSRRGPVRSRPPPTALIPSVKISSAACALPSLAPCADEPYCARVSHLSSVVRATHVDVHERHWCPSRGPRLENPSWNRSTSSVMGSSSSGP